MSDLPDKNLFMMLRKPNPHAMTPLPDGYHFSLCKPEDLHTWFAFPFDRAEDARQHMNYMQAYFQRVYAPRAELFFSRCLFVVSPDGAKVGTCFLWPAYGRITTLHWLKVRLSHEGLGLGRALITRVLRQAHPDDYPIYLHTQPESYRAIGLYADFGFSLITDPIVGHRRNDLYECLPWLKQRMGRHFEKLTYDTADRALLTAAANAGDSEF